MQQLQQLRQPGLVLLSPCSEGMWSTWQNFQAILSLTRLGISALCLKNKAKSRISGTSLIREQARVCPRSSASSLGHRRVKDKLCLLRWWHEATDLGMCSQSGIAKTCQLFPHLTDVGTSFVEDLASTVSRRLVGESAMRTNQRPDAFLLLGVLDIDDHGKQPDEAATPVSHN